jgi:beta-glucosidase
VCTINEINIPKMFGRLVHRDQDLGRGFDEKIAPAAKLFNVTPDRFSPFFFAGTPDGTKILLSAHKEAVRAIRAEREGLSVGMTIAMQDMQAINGGEETRNRFRREIQDIWLEAARIDDFVGVQTYSRERYGPEGPLGPEDGIELTQMGYEFWPEALEATLRYADEVAGVPLIVTENGIGTADDIRRIAYYQKALTGVAKILADGIDLRGYFAWSAFDNFEWMLGYGPKFGLIAVDRETQKRTVKPSAQMLGKIARENSFNLNDRS